MVHEDQQDTINYKYIVAISLDNDGFFRHSCPKCGLTFKTYDEGESGRDILEPLFQKMENHSGQDENSPVRYLSCPYCSNQAEQPEFVTPDMLGFIKQWAYREILYPRVNEMLSDFARKTKQSNRRQRGKLFSVSIEFQHKAEPQPLRPIFPIVLDDMYRVKLKCCSKTVKIDYFGNNFVRCPFCEQMLVLS